MKERVKRYYEKRAKTYEDLDEPVTIVSAVRAIGIKDHLNIIDPKKGDLVLDVGCGQGRFLEPFNRAAKAVGVDFTMEMLEKSKKTGAYLVRGDAEHLPFKDGAFEITHSAGLLGVYRSEKICREMVRVTKNRGRTFISFPARASVSGAVAVFFIWLGWNPTLLDFWYSKNDIKRLFQGDGRIKGFHRLGFEPPFQRLYKGLRSKKAVRSFMFIERKLRDKPFFRYFGARWLVEVER